jgi:hypothetical protein
MKAGSGFARATNNLIVANKISGPSKAGISLRNCIPSVFYDNIIAFNDLRGCKTLLEIPPEILEVNTVRMNLT